MRKFLQDILLLRPGERRGLVFSMTVFCVVLMIRLNVHTASNTEPERMSDSTAREVIALIAELKAQESQRQTKEHPPQKRQTVLSPYPFDPNAISGKELLEMGIPPKIVSNLCRYREAGGTFNKVKSVRKIYGMTEEIWKALEPMITIPDTISSTPGIKAGLPAGRHSVRLVDINRAGVETVDSIRGIPSFLAERIVKYRELLGGFIGHEQLLEVYGMDSTRYGILLENTWLDSSRVRYVMLDSQGVAELKNHPYIDRSTLKKISHYLDFAGSISCIEELALQAGIRKTEIEKIAPYLRYNDEPEISADSVD